MVGGDYVAVFCINLDDCGQSLLLWTLYIGLWGVICVIIYEWIGIQSITRKDNLVVGWHFWLLWNKRIMQCLMNGIALKPLGSK